MKFKDRKNCPVCRSSNIKILFNRGLENNSLKEFIKKYFPKIFSTKKLKNYKYILINCIDCNLIFQKKVLSNKSSKLFYNKVISHEDSLRKKENFSVSDFEVYFKDLKKIENFFRRKPKHIKLLEIGAGWGFWSRIAKDLNFSIETVELSQVRRKFLSKHHIKCYPEINNIPVKKKYDVIFLDQTLEHLTDPRSIFKFSRTKLSKEGILFFKIPSGLFTRFKIRRDYEFKHDELIPLEHINIFNLKNLYIVSRMFNFKFRYLYSTNNFFSYKFFKEFLGNLHNVVTNKIIIFQKN